MTSAVRLLYPLLGGLVLALAACGGKDGGSPVTVTLTPSPATIATPTPSPTATATPIPIPTPTPTPEPVEAPHAAPIEVDPGINSLGEGSMQPILAPNGVLNLDPIQLAEGLGTAPPPCAAFVLYLSWQVRDPYPAEGVDLEFYWTRMGGTELFAEGPSGQASRGCGAIQVVNNSDVEVTVEIRYLIGEIQG